MKFRRVYSLAKKDLKGIAREPAGLFLILLFPVLMTLVFGFAFGAVGGSQPTTYPIGVINMSEGAPHPEWGQYFIGNLSQSQGLNVQIYTSNTTAQADLAQGKISAVLIIPSNFGVSVDSFLASPSNSSLWTNTTVYLYIDIGSIFAGQAVSLVQQALANTIYGTSPSPNVGPIQIGFPSLVQAKALSTFDYFAPGIFAFASIFIILTVAESLTFERDRKLLSRINTTPTTSAELMMSKTASNMVLALIQVALVIAMALVIGYHPMGDAFSLVFAFIIMAIFSLCCVGFGLIAAALSKSSGAATGISFIFIMPLMFLGTFVSVGLSSLAQAAGRFVPSYYVTDALTTLFLRGAPASSPMVLLDLAAVSIYSVVVLLIGILLFKKFVRK
jgi:ABC-type multidrug transport system permease subunit